MSNRKTFAMSSYAKHGWDNCPFCGRDNIEFFTGRRQSREAMPISYTAGVHCRNCGAVTFWTFTAEEFYNLGRDGVRTVCKRLWKGIRAYDAE